MYLSLHYNSFGYTVAGHRVEGICSSRWISISGWALETPFIYRVGYSMAQSATCSGSAFLASTQVTMTEPDGSSHHFVPEQPMIPTCFNPIPNGVAYAENGSDWMLLNFTNVPTEPSRNQITGAIAGAAGNSHHLRRTYDLHPDVAGQETIVELYVRDE